MDYFNQQDKFLTDMVTAYRTGRLSSVFRPYIEWKIGGKLFSNAEAYSMMNTASELLDKMFDMPDVDEELRSYIEGIDGEITNILPLLL